MHAVGHRNCLDSVPCFLDVEMHVTVSECNVFRDQFVVKSRKTPNQLFVASLQGVDIDYRDL